MLGDSLKIHHKKPTVRKGYQNTSEIGLEDEGPRTVSFSINKMLLKTDVSFGD